jgi:hypothetical protein
MYVRGRGLQCDGTSKMKFNEVRLNVFSISIRKEYPVISANAVKILLQFSTSSLCEQAFLVSDKYYNQRQKSSAVCGGRTASVFVRNSAKNSTFVQKERSRTVALKVNFTLTLDISFILMCKFNFISNCYFNIF